MDSEILTLQVDINDEPMNQKVESIEEKISTLKKNAEQVSTESVLPGYGESLSGKISEWQKDLDNILRARQAMEHAASSYDRQDLAASYQRKIEVANKSIKDLANSQAIAKQLTDSLGEAMSESFSVGLKGVVTQLATGIRTTAKDISVKVSRKLTDDEIVDKYMKSDNYRQIEQRLHQDNPNLYSRQNMRQYLMASIPMSVPQYMREAVTGGSQIAFGRKPSSFRGMLPDAFQNIPAYSKPKDIRLLGSTQHGNETLTVDEIESLNRLVRNNRYAADAAVKAGIISKKNGALYFNHATTHDMVNAMAGFTMDDVVKAAQGERKYGITNVESTKFWNNILGKIGNNNVLDSGLSTMRAMQDAFGGWLNPGRYAAEDKNGRRIQIPKFDASAENAQAEYVGRITHSPRKDSRAFAEYTLEMMENGAQINGQNPTVLKNGKWTTLKGVTGPRNGITPDDFHTISLRDSLLYRMVASTPSAKKVGHNDFDDNLLYLKYDDALGNPSLSNEEREKFVQRYAKVLANGYTANGRKYISTRIGKTHAEFMAEDIVDDIGRRALGSGAANASPDAIRKAGLAILANDGGQIADRKEHFEDFKTFAKTMYNQNNIATEGESLETWLGTDKKLKVVVGRFGDKDMDGSNWISDKVSNVGFQGRSFGGKATYVPVNMEDFRFKNYQQIQNTEETTARIAALNEETSRKLEKINSGETNEEWRKQRTAEIEAEHRSKAAAIMQQYGGDLVIPKAGVNGGDLIIPKDTDIIEDINNIKYFKTAPNMSQEEWNKARSEAYEDYGLFAKTTYDDANTSSRWLSKQVVNSSMNAGFRDPRVARYFDKVFFDELARLDNDQYVRDTLFQGDQTIDLQSKEAQKKIQDHIGGMWARYSEGDRLLPTGVFKYAMAAPNPQNVINNRLLEAGIALTPEQEALQLKDNQVISMESLNKQLGIVRFPATKSGNITADNVSAERLIAEGKATPQQIKNIARSSGIVDTKGLYFAPNSPILKLLQGEDFDGDINGYFGLSDNLNPDDAKEFSEVMRIIANASDKEVREIWEAESGTKEFYEKVSAQEERKGHQTYTPKDKKEGYSTTNDIDRASYLVNIPREHAMMGAAERSADMAALYYSGLNNPKLRSDLAQAIRDYESQYDVVSTNMKTNERWNRTVEQGVAANLGLSFSRMFKYANEAVETAGQNDDSTKIWNGKSFQYLADKNIDVLGLPSVFQSGLMGTLIGRAQVRARGEDPEEGVYKWDEVLDKLQLPEGVDKDSEAGKFVRMMRGVRSDYLTSKYLVADSSIVDALDEQYQKAEEEIAKTINPEDANAFEELRTRMAAIGGQAFENFKLYGPTAENVEKAPWVKAALDDLSKKTGMPVSSFYSGAVQTQIETRPETVKASEQKGTATPSQQPASTTTAQSANITTSKTLPYEARAPFENINVNEEESPEEEARRLLKEAGIKQIKPILDANKREALVAAINNDSVEELRAIKGIDKTAPAILSALKGSKITQIQTTSSEEMEKPVAVVTVPDSVFPTEKTSEKQQPKPKEDTSADSPKKPESVIAKQSPKQKESVSEMTPEQQEQLEKAFEETQAKKPTGFMADWFTKAAQSNYEQIITKASDFSKSLFGQTLGYQSKLEEVPQSINQYRRNDAIARRYAEQINDFKRSEAYNMLTRTQQDDLERFVSPNTGVIAMAGKDFAELSKLTSKSFTEDILTANKQASGTYDAQVEALDKWEKKIKEVEEEQAQLLEMAKDPKYSKSNQEKFAKDAEIVGQNLETLKQEHERLKEYTNTNVAIRAQQSDFQIDQMTRRTSQLVKNPYGTRRDIFYRAEAARNSALTQLQTQKGQIDARLATEKNKLEGMDSTDEQYQKTADHVRDLQKASEDAGAAIQQLSGPMGAAGAVAAQFGDRIANVAKRLGRQLFHKALQETKKFIKEFDAQMNEIQAITMKSGDEMQEIRSQTINKAIGLRTSVSNVSSVEAALYRQGLSDQEVSSRTESIIKFATVTKLNVAEATKIITTALQNDLVPSAEAAMDALVALGDSAATTAAEIGKGMQKAAASAKVAGVSYEELTALLTIGTSDTQLSGTQVGTALQTVFTRMRRLSLDKFVADQNGEKTTASDAEAALKSVGVDLWDDKAIGKMRSAYDVILDLSKVWKNLSDAQKSIVTNSLAGTRQTNIFSTLMEGMSEDEGKTLEKYLGLASGSEGITQSKYEIAMQSLAASMDTLKSSWDAVVESFTNSGIITGALDTVSDLLQGIAGTAENGGGPGVVLSGVAAGIAAIAVALSGVAKGPAGILLQILAALGTFAVGAGVTSGITALFNPETEDEKAARQNATRWNNIQKSQEYRKSDETAIKRAIQDVEDAGTAFDKLSNQENTDKLVFALQNLSNVFPVVSDSVKDSIANLNDWTKAVDDANEKAKQFTKDNIGALVDDTMSYITENTPADFRNAMKQVISPEDYDSAKTGLSKSIAGLISEESSIGDKFTPYLNGILSVDTDKLFQIGTSQEKAEALLAGYRNNKDFKKVVDAFIQNDTLLGVLNDTSNQNPFKDGMLVEEAAGVFNNVYNKITNEPDLYTGINKALQYQYKNNKFQDIADEEILGSYFDENGNFDVKTVGKHSVKNNAWMLFRTLLGSQQARNWIDENADFKSADVLQYFKNLEYDNNHNIDYENWNDVATMNQYSHALWNMANDSESSSYFVKRRQAALKFLQEDIPSRIPFEEMAQTSENYDADFLKKTFISAIAKTDIIDTEGNMDEAALQEFVSNFLNGWAEGAETYLNQYVAENAPDDAYSYFLGEGESRQKFTSMEQALQAVRDSNGTYKFTDITDNEGNTAYTTSREAVQALNVQNAANQAAKNLNDFVQIATKETTQSIKDIENAYDETGTSGVLASVLGSNSELLGAYLMTQNGQMSFDEFKETAKNLNTGRPGSGADIITTVLNAATEDKSLIEKLRTDKNYEGVYKAFQSLVGDSADAVLNAIEDGVSNPDAMKAFDKALITQRVKEAMQFSEHYNQALSYATTTLTGSENERLQANASIKSETQSYYDYAAAVQRYVSGNARDEDFATIASYDNTFTEQELKNQNLGAQVSANQQIKLDNLLSQRQDEFNALLYGAGINPTDYAKLDEAATQQEIEDFVSKTTGLNRSNPAFWDIVQSNSGMTRRELANRLNPQFDSSMSSWLNSSMYQIDANGNVVLKPGAEAQANYDSIINDVNRLFRAQNFQNEYTSLRQFGNVGGEWKNLGSWWTASGKDTDRLNKLLSSDETLKNLLAAQNISPDLISDEVITGYVNRAAEGRQGTFAERNDWLMKTLLGEDWQDISKWDIKAAAGNYDELRASVLGPFFETMFGEMKGGEDFKKYLTGDAAALPENFAQSFVEWMTSESTKELRKSQEIAQNAGVFAAGTENERASLTSGYFSQAVNIGRAAQAVVGENTSANQGYIASALGIDQSLVKSMMGSEAGKSALQTLLQNTETEAVETIAKTISSAFEGVDLTATDFTSLETQIRDAAKTADAETSAKLLAIADALTSASGIVAESDVTDITAAIDNANSELEYSRNNETGWNWLNENYNKIVFGEGPIYNDNGELLSKEQALQVAASTAGVDWNQFVKSNPLFLSATNLAMQKSLTKEQMSAILAGNQPGAVKTPEYYSAIASGLFNDYFSGGAFNVEESQMQAFSESFASLQNNEEGVLLDELTGKYTKLADIIDLIGKGRTKEAAEALQSLNSEISKEATSNATKYTKALSGLDNIVAGLKKGGTDGAKATVQLRKSLNDLQDQRTALAKAQKKDGSYKSGKEIKAGQGGSKTLDILAQVLETDAKTLENFSAEDMQEALKGQTDHLNAVFGDTIQQMINEAVQVSPSIDLGAVKAVINGEMDLSALQGAVSDEAYRILQSIMSVQGKYGEVVVDFDENGNLIPITAKFDPSGNLGYHGGGGGGGGGKSATDKLLEEQGHKQKEISHKQKMAELQYQAYEQAGDYSGMRESLEQQAALKQEEYDLYQAQIAELKAQMEKVPVNSDDWYKLRDALYQLEESAKDAANALEDTKWQATQLTLKENQNKRTTTEHRVSIAEARAQKYQLREQLGYNTFGSWLEAQEAIQTERANSLKLYKNERKSTLKEMEGYVEGSDRWTELRDKVYQIDENIAALENEKLQSQIDINGAQVSHIESNLQHATEDQTHLINAQSTLAGMYSAHDNGKQYRKLLSQQNSKYEIQIGDYQEAMAQMEDLMGTLRKHSDAWYSARDAVYSYSEAILTASNAIDENNRAIQQSEVHDLTSKYDKDAADMQHTMNMYDLQLEKAAFLQDDSSYLDILDQKLEAHTEQRKQAEKDLKALEKLATKSITIYGETTEPGKQYTQYYGEDGQLHYSISEMYDKSLIAGEQHISESTGALPIGEETLDTLEAINYINDPQAWEELRTKIEAAREAVAKYYNEEMQMSAEANRKLFEYAKENYEIENSRQQHELNSVRYEQTYRKNRGEYTLYGKQLERELQLLDNDVGLSGTEAFGTTEGTGYADESEGVVLTGGEGLVSISEEPVSVRNDRKKQGYQELEGRPHAEQQQEGQKQILERYIDELKAQQKAVSKAKIDAEGHIDTELYESITQELMKQQEEYQKLIIEIDKLNDALDENKEKIRQIQMALENAIDKEIKARIQKAKNMLAAEVTLQNDILNVIKKSYQEQWDIIRKDIDKKKQALNEEKSLINERLNARKKAQSQEDKEEELAEYKRQLAIISADQSRTKDAKELQRKIEEIEQDLAWQTAEDEAAAAIDAIDDTIAAYDSYVSQKTDELNEKLKDNNNLVNEEIFKTAFMGETSDNYVAAMKANNEDYQYATPEAQQKMVEAWEDTWKQMKGIVDTYWNTDDFKTAMKSEKGFLQYMAQSDEFLSASETGKSSLIYRWRDMYENYISANRGSSPDENIETLEGFTTGEHAILDGINQMKDWTYTIGLSQETTDTLKTLLEKYGADIYTKYTTAMQAEQDVDEGLDAQIGKDIDESIAGIYSHSKPKEEDEGGSGSGGDGGSGESGLPEEQTKKYWRVSLVPSVPYATKENAQKRIDSEIAKYIEEREAAREAGSWGGVATAEANIEKWKNATISYYKYGGLVDYTGPAWVDGTKQRPEAFLDAYDTETLRAMTDALNYVRVNTGFTPNTEAYSSTSNSIGDLIININHADLTSDANLDELARTIGQKFTKELSKSGLSFTGYSF